MNEKVKFDYEERKQGETGTSFIICKDKAVSLGYLYFQFLSSDSEETIADDFGVEASVCRFCLGAVIVLRA